MATNKSPWIGSLAGADKPLVLHLFDQPRGLVIADRQLALNVRGRAFAVFQHDGNGLVVSAPSVRYKVTLKDGSTIAVDNPGNWPDPIKIANVTEPYIKASILTPEESVAGLLKLIDGSLRRRLESLGESLTRAPLGVAGSAD